MRFTDNASITATNMATNDILAGTDVSAGTDKKFTLANLASWILDKFTGLSLGGKSQSVKAAIDATIAQGNNMTRLVSPSLLDATIDAGNYYVTGATDTPSDTGGSGYFTVETRESYETVLRRVFYQPFSTYDVWENQRRNNENWTGWTLLLRREEVNAIANAGAKNLLPIRNTSRTVNGVEFTVNADGSITVNGTNTGNAIAYIINAPSVSENRMDWSGRTLIVSGSPSDSSERTYALRVYEAGNGKGYETGGGLKFTGVATNNIGIWVAAGATVENATFYPMVRDASIADDTFVPYGKTNAVLTAESAYRAVSIPVTIGANTANAYLGRSGNVVTFNLTIGGAAFSGMVSGDSVATLPTGYRPPTAIFINGAARDNGTWASANYIFANLTVRPDGTIKLYAEQSSLETMKYMTVSGSWLTTEAMPMV